MPHQIVFFGLVCEETSRVSDMDIPIKIPSFIRHVLSFSVYFVLFLIVLNFQFQTGNQSPNPVAFFWSWNRESVRSWIWARI